MHMLDEFYSCSILTQPSLGNHFLPCKGVDIRVLVDWVVHIPYLVLLLSTFLGSNSIF